VVSAAPQSGLLAMAELGDPAARRRCDRGDDRRHSLQPAMDVVHNGVAVVDHGPGLGAVARPNAALGPQGVGRLASLEVRQSRRPSAAAGAHAVFWPRCNGQPLPGNQRTDDRYELLYKFQGLLKAFGFSGIVVLVDRVDEPHLMNGSLENMKGLVWSMLDNKFLKQPGLGLKLLLPIELAGFVEKENRDFYQRARLDKQNMVPSLEWTGQSLYDLANARVAACAARGASPQIRELFDESIGEGRLIDAFGSLRVPRHLFKFLYRTLAAHCQQHVDTSPEWKVSPSTFETQLALSRRDQQAVDRGLGP